MGVDCVGDGESDKKPRQGEKARGDSRRVVKGLDVQPSGAEIEKSMASWKHLDEIKGDREFPTGEAGMSPCVEFKATGLASPSRQEGATRKGELTIDLHLFCCKTFLWLPKSNLSKSF